MLDPETVKRLSLLKKEVEATEAESRRRVPVVEIPVVVVVPAAAFKKLGLEPRGRGWRRDRSGGMGR